MQTTCAVLTPRAVWCRASAPAGLAKLSQLLALSAWHLIAQGRSESSSDKQISALRIEVSDQSPTGARGGARLVKLMMRYIDMGDGRSGGIMS